MRRAGAESVGGAWSRRRDDRIVAMEATIREAKSPAESQRAREQVGPAFPVHAEWQLTKGAALDRESERAEPNLRWRVVR